MKTANAWGFRYICHIFPSIIYFFQKHVNITDFMAVRDSLPGHKAVMHGVSLPWVPTESKTLLTGLAKAPEVHQGAVTVCAHQKKSPRYHSGNPNHLQRKGEQN